MTEEFGFNQKFAAVITNVPFKKKVKIRNNKRVNSKINKGTIEKIAGNSGADLFGIAPLSRLEDFSATKRLLKFFPEAKSVIVIGMHYPDALMNIGKETPCDKLGAYSFAQYQTHRELGFIAIEIAKKINKNGYKALPIIDCCDTATVKTINLRGTPPPKTSMQRGLVGVLPYGLIPDIASSRFAAIAAGLGVLGYNGMVITPQFGVCQRFISIITDLCLPYDELLDIPSPCEECGSKCIQSCPVNALSKDNLIDVKIGDRVYSYAEKNPLQCMWAKTYGLVAEAGMKYLKSKTDIYPPVKITHKSFCKAISERDELQDHFTAVLEKCVEACPGFKQ